MRGLPRGGCHSPCICAVHRPRLCYRPATTRAVTRRGGFSSFPFSSGAYFANALRAGTLPRCTQHHCARWRDVEGCVLSRALILSPPLTPRCDCDAAAAFSELVPLFWATVWSLPTAGASTIARGIVRCEIVGSMWLTGLTAPFLTLLHP
jgi:hypothetical protein